MNNGNYESKILDAIQIVVDNAISKAQYDRTIQATIVRCEDETIGDYIVQYQDSTFHAYSYNTDVTYIKGSTVYVLVPCGDFSLEKSIVGSVDKIGPDYISIVEGEDAYEVVGVNTIDNKSGFGLCSYTNPDTVILYDRDAAIDLVDLNTFAIEKYIKESNSLICGATILTKLSAEQKYKGNYGLIFSLDFKDNATGEIVTRQYLVDVNKMTGNPYNYTIATRQYSIFDIDGKNFDSVKQISIYSCDFPKTEENKEDDIFISKIELCGATLLDPALTSSSMLSFITPQGIYFDDQDLDSATREIHAQIKIKSKAINNTSQLVKYYWFIENNEVNSQHKKYNRYGGIGWECLNDFSEVEDSTVVWASSDYKFTVKKEDIVAREIIYKCVAVYNNETVLTRTIKIYNYSSPYIIEIKSDSGVDFYYDQGRPNLTCYVNGEEKTSSDFEYVWSSVNQNNDFGILEETTLENETYNAAVSAYNTLIAQIEAEQVLPGAAQNKINEYQKTISIYENKMRVEKNKIHKLQISNITGFSTYQCSVYYKDIFIGSSNIIITNSLTNLNDYSLVITNGNQVFKYNEKGYAPNHPVLDTQLEILPLSFILYDDKGRAVENVDKIEWYIPKGTDTLISPSIYQEYKTNDFYYIVNDKEINFNIENTYNFKKINNVIKLIVTYKEKTITAYTNLTFTKEGEAGTNGTDYICKIVPYTNDNSVLKDYPMIIHNQATGQSTWNFTPHSTGVCFKVQLWKDGEQIFENNVSGQSLDNENVQLEWSMLQNNYGNENVDMSDFTVDPQTGYIEFTPDTCAIPCNILKCKLTYNNMELFATLPIITAYIANRNYQISLVKDTGFRYAMYTADGKEPQYSNNKPFTLQVLQDINGTFEDVSNRAENYIVNYDWSVLGEVYYTEWQPEQNLIEKTAYNRTGNKNEYHVKPIDSFNGLCVNNAILCSLTQDNNSIGYIHIPVHLYINRYGNSAFNDWDGNSISIGENGDIILSPQVGAGKKNDDNSFTGVFMGSIQESGAAAPEHGLFGYNSGQRTISLNSEDGSARFGVEGKGQIIIDPSTGDAILTSGNYDEEAGTGMEINLSKPSIKFGSGKFGVNAEGQLFADGFATSEYVDSKVEGFEGELENTNQNVDDLMNSVQYFEVFTNTDTVTFPTNADLKVKKAETYIIDLVCTFKGKTVLPTKVELLEPLNGINITTTNTTLEFNITNTDLSFIEELYKTSFKITYKDTKDNQLYTKQKQINIVFVPSGADGHEGQDGKSAYQIWLEAGNTGTEQEYLNSLKGADGKPGDNGTDGKSAYQVWLDAGNTGSEEDYLNSLKGTDGDPGEDGIGIVSIIEEYYLSTSSETQTGGSWSTTQEPWESGKFIWTRSKITWTEGDPTYTDPVLAKAINSANENANAADELAQEAKSGLETLADTLDEQVKDLQKQIDGAIETWFEDYVPTDLTEPTKTWIDKDLQEEHVGDLFYIISGERSGQCYRYAYADNTYKWLIVEDADLAKAIADAAKAQATADGKATIYTGTTTPTNPQGGDLWMKSANDGILTYVNGSWIEYNKYTDDALATEAKNTADSAKQTADSANQTATNAHNEVQNTVKQVDVEYYVASSETEVPTSSSNWTTIAPQWSAGKFIWSRQKMTFVDASKPAQYSEPARVTGATGKAGKDGEDGLSAYQIAVAEGFKGTEAEWLVSLVGKDGVDGKDGTQGIQGPPGSDGKTSYLHIAYANSADGVTDFSTTVSTNKLYIGQYTDFTEADSTTPSKYSWTLIKGADGKDGQDGTNGVGVKSIVNKYALTTDTTAPSKTSTSWKDTPQTITSTNKYLWNYEIITYTNNTTNETTPHIIGAYGDKGTDGGNGTDGKGIVSITEYFKVGTSNTTAPTGTWSTTPETMDSTNKYLWSYEVIKYTIGSDTETKKRVIGTYGEKGANGTSVTISSTEIKYQTSSSGTVAPTDESKWTTTIPNVSAGQYLWTRTIVTYSTGVKTTSYSVSRSGTNGNNGTSISISSKEVKYQASASGSTPPTDESKWSTSITATPGEYLWTRTTVIYSSGDKTIAYSVGYIGTDGEDGATGNGYVYIEGTQTESTASWTGTTSEISALEAGTQILYKLPYAGKSNVTLNLTLADGSTTGAIACYFVGTTRLSTQYAANATIALMYDGSVWRAVNPYTNSNNYDRILYNANIKATSAVKAGQIIVGTSSGYVPVAAGVSFDLNYPILYAGAAIAANATSKGAYLTYPATDVTKTLSTASLTINSMLYLVGTLEENIFTIDTQVFAHQGETPTDLYYIPIGIAFSNVGIYFNSSTSICKWGDSGFTDISFANNINGLVSHITVLYAFSNSSADIPEDDQWLEVYDETKRASFTHVWQKIKTTFKDGTTTETAPTCLSGKTIVNTATEYTYQTFDSLMKIPEGTTPDEKANIFNTDSEKYEWQVQKKSIADIMDLENEAGGIGYYEWLRTHIFWSDGTSTYSTPYCDDTTRTLRTQINDRATQIINSLEGEGCVRIYENQIYVMNKASIEDSTEILCLNNQGIGFAKKEVGEDIDPNAFTSVWHLSGEFDAQKIRVYHLTADDITNGTFRLYDSAGNENDGKILIFEGDPPAEINPNDDHTALISLTLDGLVIKLTNGGTFSVTRQNGISVFNSGGEFVYGSSSDGNAFLATKTIVEQQIDFGESLRGIVMEKTLNSKTHKGVGFIRISK